jgi:hypothetical protein
VNARHCILTLAVAVPLVGLSAAPAWAGKIPAKEPVNFGTLRTVSLEAARSQALNWLKSTGKTDATTMKECDKIWSTADQPILDRVANTFALGAPAAAKLLAEARDPLAAAPTTVPALLQDAKQPAFYRANLALAYAKALSNKRVFEEVLETLKVIKPEDVVDPSAYFFHRAVAEHAMLLKTDAIRSLIGLTEDVADTPERYKMVGALMYHDMLMWKEKDLGEIARKMDNIERRLALARGGPRTQKIQKEVVARLDELIKKLENQCNGCCSGNGGGCPNGGNGGGATPSSPMRDSNIATNSGPGNIDQKRLRGLAQQWGKLPEKERAQAMQDLIKDMPARHREIIETYFRKLAQNQPSQP